MVLHLTSVKPIRDWGKKEKRVLCYRCGKYGYLGLGWMSRKYRRKRIDKGKKVFYGWYPFFYVSHYSPKRKRCYVPEGIAWDDSFVVDEYYLSACCSCSYDIPRLCYWQPYYDMIRRSWEKENVIHPIPSPT
jgi:hypothetical protein